MINNFSFSPLQWTKPEVGSQAGQHQNLMTMQDVSFRSRTRQASDEQSSLISLYQNKHSYSGSCKHYPTAIGIESCPAVVSEWRVVRRHCSLKETGTHIFKLTYKTSKIRILLSLVEFVSCDLMKQWEKNSLTLIA